MPRRSPPGDRARIEAQLTPEQRTALAQACRAFGIPRGMWQREPSLERTFTRIAVAQLAAQVRAERGSSEKDALDSAAIMLGLGSGEAVARAIYRARAA